MIQQTPIPTDELGACGFIREGSGWTLALDAIAAAHSANDNNSPLLYLFSAVGPATAVKAVTAILRGDVPASFWARLPGQNKQTYYDRHCERYDIHRTRLAFDQWHLLAVAQDEKLITNLSQLALWREFSGPRFTTPLLRSWTPWLSKHFLATNVLRRLTSWRCDAAILDVNPHNLDIAVTEGIKKQELCFE